MFPQPASNSKGRARPEHRGLVLGVQHCRAAVLHHHRRLQPQPRLRLQHVRGGASLLAARHRPGGADFQAHQHPAPFGRRSRRRVCPAVQLPLPPGRLPHPHPGLPAALQCVHHGPGQPHPPDHAQCQARQRRHDVPDHVPAQRRWQHDPHLHHPGADQGHVHPQRLQHPVCAQLHPPVAVLLHAQSCQAAAHARRRRGC
mmetsp:Transcript_4466/g.12151  ORF Transcript_4466/g.12151 Transcript_4466/m.12151 type:complete len:200 (+) Transcript_4466:1677-2276(+)